MAIYRSNQPFYKDSEQAHKTAHIQLQFALDNKEALARADKKGTLTKALRDFVSLLNGGKKLTGPQLNLCNTIYEKTMSGLGLPACNTKHDFGRKK